MSNVTTKNLVARLKASTTNMSALLLVCDIEESNMPADIKESATNHIMHKVNDNMKSLRLQQ